jgi:hypothetical protein
MNPTVSCMSEVSRGVSATTIGRLKTAIQQGKALVSAWRLSDQIVRSQGEIDAGCGCGCQPAE